MPQEAPVKPLLTDTIEAGKRWLLARVDHGDHCPLCGQMAKVYKRKINATMARTLITLWNVAERDFAHGPSLPGDTHEISQLVWWGLVEEESRARPDGGQAGWWRITDAGISFVMGTASVPKYARIYDGRRLGHEGDPVDIKDALGTKFSYEDLMRGV